jgi:hypothetical protein
MKVWQEDGLFYVLTGHVARVRKHAYAGTVMWSCTCTHVRIWSLMFGPGNV